MRLSISLDDDVYALARSLARAEDITVSAAVNRLIRKGVSVHAASTSKPRLRNGLRVSAGRVPVTADTLHQVEQEDDRA